MDNLKRIVYTYVVRLREKISKGEIEMKKKNQVRMDKFMWSVGDLKVITPKTDKTENKEQGGSKNDKRDDTTSNQRQSRGY